MSLSACLAQKQTNLAPLPTLPPFWKGRPGKRGLEPAVKGGSNQGSRESPWLVEPAAKCRSAVEVASGSAWFRASEWRQPVVCDVPPHLENWVFSLWKEKSLFRLSPCIRRALGGCVPLVTGNAAAPQSLSSSSCGLTVSAATPDACTAGGVWSRKPGNRPLGVQGFRGRGVGSPLRIHGLGRAPPAAQAGVWVPRGN